MDYGLWTMNFPFILHSEMVYLRPSYHMAAKIFKVIWFVSLLTMMGVLIYCYASWPEAVYLSDSNPPQMLGKSALFYSVIGLLGIFNMLAFVFPKLKYSDTWMAWFFGVLVCLHIFLVSGTIFITIFNSSESYNYANIGPMLYTSLGLLAAWVLAGPVVAVISKKQAQRQVLGE
jgi:hypothetical protein